MTTETRTIRIVHDHENGTRVEGSAKGDGVYELLNRLGWQYRRWAGVHVRGSRDQFSFDVHALERGRKALEEAGWTVELDINDEWRPAAVRERERGERVEARVDRLADRAERAERRSDAARDARRAISDGIPFGQPILVGHHSEGRARRDAARMDAGMRREIKEAEYAGHLASRADGAASNEAHKHDPRAILRRIDTLQTELRRWESWLDDPAVSPAGRVRTQLRVDRHREEIKHLNGNLARHAETGAFVAWGPEHFRKDDLVNVHGMWCRVRRVNRKTVSVPWIVGSMSSGVESEHSDTVPWDKIHGRRRDGMQLDTPNGQEWPVELADRVARWDGLARSLRADPHDDETRARHLRVRRAQRLVHGLDLDAGGAEAAAYQEQVTDLDRLRELASASLTVYDRLKAGEKPADVAASVTPFAGVEPTWRLPTGREPVDRRVDQLAPGDIVKGYWDRGSFGGQRRLFRGFCGPVAAVGAVRNRREAGEWVDVTLQGGATREFQTHMWLAVYPVD